MSHGDNPGDDSFDVRVSKLPDLIGRESSLQNIFKINLEKYYSKFVIQIRNEIITIFNFIF